MRTITILKLVKFFKDSHLVLVTLICHNNDQYMLIIDSGAKSLKENTRFVP